MGVPRKQLLKMRGIQKPWFPALLWPLLWLESWNLRGAPRQVPATNCQRKLQDWDQTMIVPVENCMPHHQFERGDWAYQSFFVLVPYTSPTVLLQPFWSLMPTLLLTPAHQVCWQWCLHGPHHKDSGWDMSMWKVNLFQQIQQWPQRHLQVSGYLLVPREASTRCICLSLIIWAGLNVTIICFTRYSLNQSALEYNQISTSHEYLKFYLTQIYETMRGTRRGAREWSFLGKRISHKCIAAIWGSGPKDSQELGQVYWIYGTDALVLKPSWFGKNMSCAKFYTSVVSPIILYNMRFPIYLWLLLLWFIHSPTQEKKRKPLQYMRLDRFFMTLYIKQAGMLPTRCLSQIDKMTGCVYPSN